MADKKLSEAASTPEEPPRVRLADLQRICGLNAAQAMRVRDYFERRATPGEIPTPETAFTAGDICPCGADVKVVPGIGPYCTRTGLDAPCQRPTRRRSSR